MSTYRIPISPENCEVLGYKVRASDPMWTGLDLSRVVSRVECVRLEVPWCHPEDQTGDPEDFDCVYRVRPRMEAGKKWKGKLVESVSFEKLDDKWFIAIKTWDKVMNGMPRGARA